MPILLLTRETYVGLLQVSCGVGADDKEGKITLNTASISVQKESAEELESYKQ